MTAIIFGDPLPKDVELPWVAYYCGNCSLAVDSDDDKPGRGCPHCGAPVPAEALLREMERVADVLRRLQEQVDEYDALYDELEARRKRYLESRRPPAAVSAVPHDKRSTR